MNARAPLWATGQIAVQLYRDAPSLLLLFYMTQVLAVPPALAGAAIFIPKLVWAAVCDYAVGAASDRWRGRVERRTFLLAGALLAPAAMILLFQPPPSDVASGRALYVALVLTVYMAGFSIFSVPHLAIGTEMGANSSDRAAVMGWRIVFANIGLLIGASFAPVLVQRLGGGQFGYSVMGVALAAIVSLALLVSWAGSREPPAAPVAHEAGLWRGLFTDRGALALFAATLLQLTGQGLAFAAFAYLFTYNLAFAEPLAMVGLVVLVSSGVAIVTQPLWVRAVRRFGAKSVFLAATIGYAASLVVFALLPPANTALAIAAAVLLGAASPGCFLALFAMLGDVVARDAGRGGRSRAGLYSATFIVIDKVGFALGGTLLAGLILAAFGFEAGGGAQGEQALTGIAIVIGGVPLLLNIAAFLILAFGYHDEEPGLAPT